MSRPSRRRVLAGSAGLIALAAGCLDDGGLATSPDPTDESENGSDDGEGDGGENDTGDGNENDENDEEDEDDDALEYETVGFQHPDWPENPEADLLRTEDDADDWAEERGLEDDEEVMAFIDDTDFDGSRVVSLEGGATNLCYELAVETVDLEDETVTIQGEITDEYADGEMCAEQMTAVAALVRARVDDEQPSSFSVTIVDADGAEHGTGIGVGSDSDEAAESDGGNGSRSATDSAEASGNETDSEGEDSS